MDDLKNLKDRLMNIKVTKSWQYLAYLYLALPGLLFLLGWTTQSKIFGSLFHNYGLFGVNPIPNLSTFTGIVGLGLAIWFLVSALRRRDWLDLAISAVLVALNAAYFLFGVNYSLLGMLSI